VTTRDRNAASCCSSARATSVSNDEAHGGVVVSPRCIEPKA
jgi:hypothetical protein